MPSSSFTPLPPPPLSSKFESTELITELYTDLAPSSPVFPAVPTSVHPPSALHSLDTYSSILKALRSTLPSLALSYVQPLTLEWVYETAQFWRWYVINHCRRNVECVSVYSFVGEFAGVNEGQKWGESIRDSGGPKVSLRYSNLFDPAFLITFLRSVITYRFENNLKPRMPFEVLPVLGEEEEEVIITTQGMQRVRECEQMIETCWTTTTNVVYIDVSVKKGATVENKIEDLYGFETTDDLSKATHVVVGGNEDFDLKYFFGEEGSASTKETIIATVRGANYCSEFKHYRRYPSSFDVWVRDEFKANKNKKTHPNNHMIQILRDPTNMEANATKSEGRCPWIVNEAWVHDSHFWSEVCNEADYEVMKREALSEEVGKVFDEVSKKVDVEEITFERIAGTSEITEKTIKDGNDDVKVYPAFLSVPANPPQTPEDTVQTIKKPTEKYDSVRMVFVEPNFTMNKNARGGGKDKEKDRVGTHTKWVGSDGGRIRGGGGASSPKPEGEGGEEKPETKSLENRVAWYTPSGMSPVEKSIFGAANPAAYVKERERLIKFYKEKGLVEPKTEVEAKIIEFLEAFSLVNCETGATKIKEPKAFDLPRAQVDALMACVEKNVQASTDGNINWRGVSAKVGLTEDVCVKAFLHFSDEDVARALNGKVYTTKDLVEQLAESVDPNVVKVAVNAALSAGADLRNARAAGVVGGVVERANRLMKEETETCDSLVAEIGRLKAEVVAARVKRVRDVEDLLEAEREELEEERRLQYFRRAKYWLGE